MNTERATGLCEFLPTTDAPRVVDLRRRMREAMKHPPVPAARPARLDPFEEGEPICVRKARAIALKLRTMPLGLWDGQLLAGSLTFESPRVHIDGALPNWLGDAELAEGRRRDLPTTCFGHIVPDYPTLLEIGLAGLRGRAEVRRHAAADAGEAAFLDSVIIALDGAMAFAERLADHCQAAAEAAGSADRAAELRRMAADLRRVPAHRAETFRQGLQSVWLTHMMLQAAGNHNALGRVDQYLWPLLEADLAAGRIGAAAAAELVDCFCLKFNERARTTDEQTPEARRDAAADPSRRSRHYTSSQLVAQRDGLDATNHWLQNVVVGGLTPDGADGTNPLTFAVLDSYRRQAMTNPALTIRLHRDTPEPLIVRACEVLKAGGGMPALFSDDAIIPALERTGIATGEARDYTNDGCWEIIIPGRTDFGFLRLSMMLCLEWALNRGRSRVGDGRSPIDPGDARRFGSFEQVWDAFAAQVEGMIERTVRRVAATIDDRSLLAPVPLLSALIDGPIAAGRDLTAGGARHRTFAMLIESASHAIDSLAAVRRVVFEDRWATMAELCDAMDADFAGFEPLRKALLAAPKYGNDDDGADAVGQRLIELFAGAVARHGGPHRGRVTFTCGVGTFSWYIGIGEGLGASPDGRRRGEPVASNFSPSLGRDVEGVPGAILSYAKMHHDLLSAGGPLDLRLPGRLVEGRAGTDRMVALCRAFVQTGGTIMTLTVADAGELRAAQADPEQHESLRVRMGGWSAYFTMLSRQQQDHQIRRQEGLA
ncbi:MAG: hypothetical protein GX591_08660 [Planctomycetes bacterium]|nr:hypothetical protein [Planctomycetota bacterium]